jgi:thiamine biosynthesis lipoprotein
LGTSLRRTGIALWLCVLAARVNPAVTAGSLLRLEKSEEAMGSSFSVILYDADRVQLEAAADRALDEVHRLDRLLSNYQAASEWSEMNRAAADRPFRLSVELFDLLSACLQYSAESDGAFDVTVGPLVRVWGFTKGDGALPRPADVSTALARVGYRYVHLDHASRTVTFDRAGMELDPGGIGKGYAVDRVVEVLKRERVNAALVSAAGSSIYALSAPPDGPDGWRITIRAPEDPNKPVAEVVLKDMAISTSGSYEKFFWAEGRTYSHLIDPRTGAPAQGTAAVSVLAPRAIDSEAWTKPYFINGRTWTAAHKRPEHRVFFCERRRPCSWID